MHRFNFRNPSAARALCLSLLSLLAACDADTICPEGFRKSGALCLEEDDGDNAIAAGHDASRADPERLGDDASTSTTSDSGSVDAASDTVSALDAAAVDAASASDAGSSLDANTTVSDAAAPLPDAATEPTPECDAVHACGSTGYTCISNKCVSACAQTRCDANATCALVRGAPVCSCNRGYLPMGSGSALTCARDVGCEELGCDANATCEVGTDRLRHCVCKTDYTGDGKTCTRISCPALSTLHVENGRITTSDGTTAVGKVATVTCTDSRYKITEGGQLFCDETGKWVGTIAKCSLITCPAPTASVEHAALTMPTQPSYRPSERATYTCAAGFKPRGDNGVTCGSNGTWSAPTLMCVAACGDGIVDQGEDCDAPANGSSAWTCSKECKFCPGGLCKPACTTANDCPQSPSNLVARCVSGACLPSQCSVTSPPRDPCPAGMCVDGDDYTRCVPTTGN